MISRVAAAANAVVVAPAASHRQSLTFFNDATGLLVLRPVEDPTTTVFTIRLAPSQEWNAPRPLAGFEWRGLWEAGAAGAVNVTEGF